MHACITRLEQFKCQTYYRHHRMDSRPKGRGFEPHRRQCAVSLSKNINPSLVLVQPRKTRPFTTERLLMGRKESNQTNKNHRMGISVVFFNSFFFVTRLAADTFLTADPGEAISIPVQSQTFVDIGRAIISTAILPSSADSRRVVVSYKRKYVHEVLVCPG